jgi:FkbM family methyltransferase
MAVRKTLARIAPLLSGDDRAGPFPAALEGDGFVLVEVDAGNFWLPADDQVMRPYFQRHHSWEESLGGLLRRLICPGSRFLDVGAAVGYFSVVAAGTAPNVTVDSIEPNPDALELLRFNLWLNGVDAQVWPVALSSTRTAIPLSGSATNLGDARTREAREGSSYSVVVPAVPADELFAGRSFDVVKIDVQGWELEVILGMQRIVHDSPDIKLVVEFWPSTLRERDLDPGQTLAAYRRLGFEIVVARDAALERISDAEAIAICDSAGSDGQVNLLLRRSA